MGKCLSIAVIVALLGISLAPVAHSRPLSWGRTSRYQRSIGTESAVTPTPTLGENEAGNVNGGSSTGGGADNNAMEDECMEKCYYNILPRHEIERLKTTVFDNFRLQGVHPGFLVSEWLENYHRVKFCSNWKNITDVEDIRCENQEPQISEDLKWDINSTMRNLTGNRLSYEVHYNESHYPRYAVDVQCETGMVQVNKRMPYLRRLSHDEGWIVDNRERAVKCAPITGE